MATLGFVNIFSADIDRLATFYSALLGLEEILTSRTEYYRGFQAGEGSIGFSTLAVYDILGLTPTVDASDRSFTTFTLGSPEELIERVGRVEALGGSVVRAPFETYYGWFQAMLRDPDGNAFRLNFPGPATSNL